jgi:hypothetical protein
MKKYFITLTLGVSVIKRSSLSRTNRPTKLERLSQATFSGLV